MQWKMKVTPPLSMTGYPKLVHGWWSTESVQCHSDNYREDDPIASIRSSINYQDMECKWK